MKNAVVLDMNDIKKRLAKEFDVPEGNVIKNQYSFTVMLESTEEEEEV